MEISIFFIRILILVIPGIISKEIYNKLIGKKDNKEWEDFSIVLIFALTSYFINGIIYNKFCDTNVIMINNINAFLDDSIKISWFETFGAIATGIILAFVASIIYSRRIINCIGQKLAITKRYGDEDVWSFFHNSLDYEWVFIRDHKLNLVYYCSIKAFSDSADKMELILKDVDVYDKYSKHLYKVETMYINRAESDITIEVPLTK